MSEGVPAPRVGLRRNAVGLGGAVIMSAAIMGPGEVFAAGETEEAAIASHRPDAG